MARTRMLDAKFKWTDMNILEILILQTPVRANIRVMTYRMIIMMLENKIKLTVATFILIYSSTQVVWFICRLISLRDINYFCNYIPITIHSYLSVVAISQVIGKAAYFRMLVSDIENHFWPEEWAPKEAKEEMKIKIGFIKYMFLSCISLTISYFIPINGFDYYRDLFPIMDLLNYFNAPKIIGWILYPAIYCVVYFAIYMCVLLTFFITSYMTQTILIKWVILNITKDLEITQNEFDIIENNECQKVIRARLKKCIKQHILLKGYAYKVQKYFFLTGAWPLAGIVILIGCLLYILLEQSDKGSALALAQEIAGCIASVFIFSFLGSTFQMQMSEIFDAALQTKWYYFNTENRKMFLVFLQNLNKEIHLDIAGMFSVNLKLSIWIFNKSFAIVSVFSKAKE